jgi:hypothetical protein
VHISADRYGIVSGLSGWGWHAVDLELVYAQRSTSGSTEREVFSLCGARSSQPIGRLGAFTYDNRWLHRLRCERCSWVVALDRGTVEQEIDLYATAAGVDALGQLLRQIFTAILADAPPGPRGQAGHRSELLAHAARHRPVMTVCQQCAQEGTAAAHGPATARCPHAAVLCDECSFTAGSWAGEHAGVTTEECVVAAPCSALGALADHYDVSLPDDEGRWW